MGLEQTEVNMQLTALQSTNLYRPNNASGIRQMFDYKTIKTDNGNVLYFI